jgi:putative acetyltransferase
MVRLERPDDIAGIREVHLASFPTGAEATLVDLLRDAGRLAVSLVAEIDGRIVGHVAFSPVSAGSGAAGLGLAPLAVLPGSRTHGIAAGLVTVGLEACTARGCGWVVVLGEPGYYGRFGFRPAEDLALTGEYGGGVAFQVLELVEGSVPANAGLVRYSPEFASVA